MNYKNIVEGRFIARPNRFVAYAEINGRTEVCHVKNTGRCKELLTEGCTVWHGFVGFDSVRDAVAEDFDRVSESFGVSGTRIDCDRTE